jgi:hypothetical protein
VLAERHHRARLRPLGALRIIRRWQFFGCRYQTFGIISAAAALGLPSILSLRRSGCLPLKIGNRVGSAAGERDDVILDLAGAATGRAARRRAGMLPLKFVLDLERAIFLRQGEARREREATRHHENAAQRHDRESASISVTAATAPPSIPSIAAPDLITRRQPRELHLDEIEVVS